jgi:lysophospholipase L1-like esterase
VRTALLLPLCLGLLGCDRRDPCLPTSGAMPQVGEHESFLARHESFLAEGRSRTFDVICLGDSLTWGWDDYRRLWKEQVTPQTTAFWAIGGDATNQLLWRIEHGELDSQHPKLVILLIGTNNTLVKNDAEDMAQSIDVILQAIKTRCPAARILLLGLLPQGYRKNDSNRRLFEQVNLRLPAIANVRGAFFRNPGQHLLEADDSLSTTISYDGTHLTEAGYRRLAEALGPIVRELLKEGS